MCDHEKMNSDEFPADFFEDKPVEWDEKAEATLRQTCAWLSVEIAGLCERHGFSCDCPSTEASGQVRQAQARPDDKDNG
jgi:hypothetical protein